MAAPVQMSTTGQPPPSPEDLSKALHLRDLPPSVTESQLREALVAFGAIHTLRIDPGKGGPYGFVRFETSEAAERAVAQGAVQLLESRIQMERFVPRPTSSSVYVRGFDTSYTEQKLKSVFGAFGEISSCAINKDQLGGSRGFGFVNFVQAESAASALSLSGQMQDGVTWFVSPAAHQGPVYSQRAQPEDWTRRNVYIAGFPAFISQANIQALCQTFGEIDSIKMQSKPEDPDQGAAFVCFKREQDADAAIAALSNTLIERCRIKVTKWKPIESRKTALPRTLMSQWPFALPYTYFPMTFQPRSQPHPPRRPHPGPAKSPVTLFDHTKYQSLNLADRKRFMGEFIFTHLKGQHGAGTGKITGMLLEIPENELLPLVQNLEALQMKANEAKEVLKRAQTQS